MFTFYLQQVSVRLSNSKGQWTETDNIKKKKNQQTNKTHKNTHSRICHNKSAEMKSDYDMISQVRDILILLPKRWSEQKLLLVWWPTQIGDWRHKSETENQVSSEHHGKAKCNYPCMWFCSC